MRKMSFTLLIIILSVVTLAGCQSEKISNDFIVIEQYIGLEVAVPVDGANKQGFEEFEEKIWETLLDNCIVKEYQQDELESLIQEIKKQYSYVTYFENQNVSDLIEEIYGMTVEEFAKGILLPDGLQCLPAKLEILERCNTNGKMSTNVHLTIREGKFHQVKRMMEAVGCPVLYLKRMTMGPIALDETLAVGQYRPLTEQELELLNQL